MLAIASKNALENPKKKKPKKSTEVLINDTEGKEAK